MLPTELLPGEGGGNKEEEWEGGGEVVDRGGPLADRPRTTRDSQSYSDSQRYSDRGPLADRPWKTNDNDGQKYSDGGALADRPRTTTGIHKCRQ